MLLSLHGCVLVGFFSLDRRVDGFLTSTRVFRPHRLVLGWSGTYAATQKCYRVIVRWIPSKSGPPLSAQRSEDPASLVVFANVGGYLYGLKNTPTAFWPSSYLADSRLQKEESPTRWCFWEIATAPASKGYATIWLVNDDRLQSVADLLPHVKLKLVPYKLVIYHEGGHFENHRDTVRSDDHIGTLVVILNSEYTGGELEILHDDESILVTGAYQWVATYGDCVHKIHPVQSGVRVSLILDIVNTKEARQDTPRYWDDPAYDFHFFTRVVRQHSPQTEHLRRTVKCGSSTKDSR